MSADVELSDNELSTLRLIRRKPGIGPDEIVAAQLVSRGLLTKNWELTEAGEEAHAANADRKIKPITRSFIGKR